MISATNEQFVSNRVKGLYPYGTDDRTRYHEHHLAAHKYVAFNAIASLAIERGGKTGDGRLGISQDECGSPTKSAPSIFSRPSTLSDTGR